jgi:hypothetical protein
MGNSTHRTCRITVSFAATFQDDGHLKDNERSSALKARPQIAAAPFPDWHPECSGEMACPSWTRSSYLPSILIGYRKQDAPQILSGIAAFGQLCVAMQRILAVPLTFLADLIGV